MDYLTITELVQQNFIDYLMITEMNLEDCL